MQGTDGLYILNSSHMSSSWYNNSLDFVSAQRWNVELDSDKIEKLSVLDDLFQISESIENAYVLLAKSWLKDPREDHIIVALPGLIYI